MIKTRDLPLLLISCSSQDIDLYARPGQHVELSLDVQVWEIWPWLLENRIHDLAPCSLLQMATCLLQCRRVYAGGEDKGKLVDWQKLHYPSPEPGLCGGPLQHPAHLWSAGDYEGTSSDDTRLQEFHNTGSNRITKRIPSEVPASTE